MLSQNRVDFVDAIGHGAGLEFGAAHVTSQMLFVITRVFKASVAMFALVLILVDGWFVPTIHPICHG